MNNFIFNNPVKIFFGKGMISNLGNEIAKYGSNVLIVYGKGSIKNNGIYNDVVAELKKAGMKWEELSGVDANPRLSTVKEGVALCKKHNIDFLLAVGGGSTIDCAKGIAVSFYHNGDPWDLWERKAAVNKALPLGTVLTLSATGSEMNVNSVITNQETIEKIGLGHPAMYPKFSILDPAYTYTVSPYQTAAGVVDIMTHIYEFYFNQIKTDYIQARMSEALLKTCIHYAKTAVNNPKNYEARANLMWAGSMALNGVIGEGVVFEGFNHTVEHAISAVYDITHAAGLAILAPQWMEYILDDTTVDRLYTFAKNVWGINDADPYTACKKGIQKTKSFYQELVMPVTLSEVNIDDSRFEEIADKVNYPIGNFKSLNRKDVIQILYKCQ